MKQKGQFCLLPERVFSHIPLNGTFPRFVTNGIYIYKRIIVQFFVIPPQNCVLNAGKPSRNIFSCNIFVGLLIFTPFPTVEIGKKLFTLFSSLFPKHILCLLCYGSSHQDAFHIRFLFVLVWKDTEELPIIPS